jgi:hypothetical protein
MHLKAETSCIPAVHGTHTHLKTIVEGWMYIPVAQNDPLPGLSMMGSPGSGASSGMMSQPGSPLTNKALPEGPAWPMAAPVVVKVQQRSGGQLGNKAAAGVAGTRHGNVCQGRRKAIDRKRLCSNFTAM